jgi:outer membrane protein insertion porin family
LIAAGLFQNVGDGNFSFWHGSGDLAYCFHLFYGRILALRLGAQVIRPFSDQDIPFYYLSEIGREETVRGFKDGRFRDRDMVLASVEYRYPIWREVDTVLFADVGQVANDIFSDMSQDDLAYGYGCGFRLHSDEGLVSTFMVGKSEDGFRFYFGLD